jgi:hypothetical protein
MTATNDARQERAGRKMPTCRFCGTSCEPGRKPKSGWLCNSCRRWQDDRNCYACGQRTTDTNVERWQARRPDSPEYEPVWAKGTKPALAATGTRKEAGD